MSSIFRRFSAGVLASVIAAGVSISPAVAETSVDITAGDGGIVQKDCATGVEYVRVDSSGLENSKACFFLTKPTGWVAVNITGSYGIVNRLKVPVSVAFKLPDGQVYWQRVIEPGKLQSIDVDNNLSTVVEIQVTPVATSAGAATGDLTINTANPHVVSLRSAGRNAAGKTLRLSWAGVELTSLDRNSGFNDRPPASRALYHAQQQLDANPDAVIWLLTLDKLEESSELWKVIKANRDGVDNYVASLRKGI
ncbi:hypothetical protein [Corynebacterium rouxii]|uniref:Secreted protein n=1 Tax=Corynebacterium rouxii TaxID=2719119 RepID=A0A6I8ME35_9CORY|nr:hypothetical protein [Corynebacterium rouxii]VZH84441.1 hypothetical protein FRC0190_00466 [Corynebacterium rouxii]